MKSFTILLYTKYDWGEQIEICKECSMHGKYKKSIHSLSENLKGKDYLEDLGINGRIILKLSLKKQV
jgi:hypothetical protein